MRGCQNHRGPPQLLDWGWFSSNFCSGQCGFADCQLDSVGPPDNYFVSWLFLSFGSGQILLPLDSLQNPRQWIKVQCENSWLSKMLILHVKLAWDPTRRTELTYFFLTPPSLSSRHQSTDLRGICPQSSFFTGVQRKGCTIKATKTCHICRNLSQTPYSKCIVFYIFCTFIPKSQTRDFIAGASNQ